MYYLQRTIRTQSMADREFDGSIPEEKELKLLEATVTSVRIQNLPKEYHAQLERYD